MSRGLNGQEIGHMPLSETQTPEKPAISAVFQGNKETGKNWRRRESNPRPVALQCRLLRV